jgi:1-deoxy-D-xylulose-5-phosphate synthase
MPRHIKATELSQDLRFSSHTLLETGTNLTVTMLLDGVKSPADLRLLTEPQLVQLATEVRAFIVEAVSNAGHGHLGSNLGVVELTFALHRVFDSPNDYILWDTGHQAYVHKIVTGRRNEFTTLRQSGGLSGYPNQRESDHDIIENSHASTVLSYAHGLAAALKAKGDHDRHVVAVIGDGSMTGGMAYEALNNLGHANSRVLIVLNDNGRSYAPTISGLTRTVSKIRALPSYARGKKKSETIINNLPLVGDLSRRTIKGVKAALREMVDEPHAFFETLGVRYVGPIDGHNIEELESAFRNASDYDGAIVVHVLTQKGKGYSFAEEDEEKNLHDVSGHFDPNTGPVASIPGQSPKTWTNQFTETLLALAREDETIHAITAAMPGPTGLLSFQAEHPDRFHDVGIAEQHAVTLAAGMALGGLRPVVALYSTFLTRAFDQANLDVGLHGLPVVFALDRAGITGDDGASHHGVLDMMLMTKVPGITVFAPSSAQELAVQLRAALSITGGPSAIRYPKGAARLVPSDQVGAGLNARKVFDAGSNPTICILAVGKLLEAAEAAADQLRNERGVGVTVWDPRVVKPLDQAMIADASRHQLVITVEDGLRDGGVGSAMADAICALRVESGHEAGPVVILGTPTRFIPQAKPGQILSELGLDAAGIFASIVKALDALPPR